MLERVKIIVDGEVVREYPHDTNFVVNEYIHIGNLEVKLRYDGESICEIRSFEDSKDFARLPKITFLSRYFRDPLNPTPNEKAMVEMLHGIVITWNNIEIKVDKYENPY